MSESARIAAARALHAAGEHLAAEAAVLDAVAKEGGSAATYRLLAGIECILGRFARERLALEHAFALDAADGPAWLRLGALRGLDGDAAGAADAYDAAIRAAPDDPTGHERLLRMRFAEGYLEESRTLAARFAAQCPDSAIPDLLSGHIEKAYGNVDMAERHYRRALKRAPNSGEAVYNLVDLAVPAPDSALAAQARTILADDATTPADRINAAFASARILDHAERYAEAMARYQHANELAKAELASQGIEYSPSGAEARVTATIAMYPGNVFADHLGPLPIDLTPIFVIGLPRSGTTLIEQILAAHPMAEAAGELSLGRECERRFRAQREASGRMGPVDATDAMDRACLEEARERYLDGLLERDLEGPWIIDKLPANFEIAGFLRLLFPEARLVHVRRDPRATCFSLYAANFGAHEPYYHDLTTLAHYYRQYRRLMTHWQAVIPDAIVDISYEELVHAPAREIPTLLKRLGLPPHEGCLRFHQNARPVLTASHAQVRQPMNPRAIDHWQHYRTWLGPLLELGAHRA